MNTKYEFINNWYDYYGIKLYEIPDSSGSTKELYKNGDEYNELKNGNPIKIEVCEYAGFINIKNISMKDIMKLPRMIEKTVVAGYKPPVSMIFNGKIKDCTGDINNFRNEKELNEKIKELLKKPCDYLLNEGRKQKQAFFVKRKEWEFKNRLHFRDHFRFHLTKEQKTNSEHLHHYRMAEIYENDEFDEITFYGRFGVKVI